MTRPSRALAAAAAAALLFPANGRATTVRIEAEAVPIDNAQCDLAYDRETMHNSPGGDWAPTGTVFYPNGSGLCTQTLSGRPEVRRITGVRFMEHNGQDGAWLCGHFELSGGAVGTTKVVCAIAGTRSFVPFQGTTRTGKITITFYVDEGSPEYSNVSVDYFTATT